MGSASAGKVVEIGSNRRVLDCTHLHSLAEWNVVIGLLR